MPPLFSIYDSKARYLILYRWPMDVEFEDSEELVNDVAGTLAWIDSLPEFDSNYRAFNQAK